MCENSVCKNTQLADAVAIRCSLPSAFLSFVTLPTTGRESVSLDCDNIWSMSVRRKEHPSGALRRQITLACLGN